MGRTACTEPQCLYKGALHFTYFEMLPLALREGSLRAFSMNCSLWNILYMVQEGRKTFVKYRMALIFVVPCIMLNSEINPTRCNSCVYTCLPEAIYSVCTPDDGWNCHPKHVEKSHCEE